ncbi:uncharacterized protein [Clytia hemisphaerica]|uniref:Uncharacterized protein n=1 Tax=Clytia hemisphaerica TaxID=252671 RepID=A0A7M5XB81_9CNID
MLQHRHAKVAAITGTIVGIFGIVLCILMVMLSSESPESTSSVPVSPYASFAVMLLTGICGVCVGIKKNRCLMILYMISNIMLTIIQLCISIFLTIFIFLLGVFVDHVDDYCATQWNGCHCVYNGQSTTIEELKDCQQIVTIHRLLTAMLVITLLTTISAFGTSIFGCFSVCCSRPVAMEPIVVEQHQMQHQIQPPPTFTQKTDA